MLCIRKASSADAAMIATCLLPAMEEIVYLFIGEADTEKAKAFMLHFMGKSDIQYSYQNCWVAEVDTGVVAAINLYDGAHLHELRQPVIDYLKSKFIKDYTTEDETQAGEYYIDCIGVLPNHQGKGIGTKLLQFVLDEYVHRHHQTAGLLVDEANPDAKRLYLNLGFKSVGKKFLFGKNLKHLQLKNWSF